MTDDLLTTFRSTAPLPDDQKARRIYAGVAARPRRAPRRRIAMALAVCIAVVVAAVGFSGVLDSSHRINQSVPQRGPAPRGARPMGCDPMRLAFTRGADGVTSIDVTVSAAIRDATMRLRVLRGSPYGPDSNRTVVFQEQVRMSNISSPAQGPPGVVALSTWSGTLSPSDWAGGCQKMLYTVAADVVPAGGSFESPQPGSESTEAAWFTCSSDARRG